MQKIVGWLLIGLCLQLFIPRELWHELSGHHDSVDVYCHEHNADVSVAHNHCLIFDLTGDPILYGGFKHFIFLQFVFVLILFGLLEQKTNCFVLQFSNKGPPLI
ncbi:MAG: hypothetical protein ACKOX3_02490 [Bacteroidota bacterium]